MISPKGKVLFDSEFKEQPTDVVGGVFFVQTGKDETWQIYDATEKTMTISDESYESILPFNENVTLAVKDGQFIKIIDKKGHEVATVNKAGADTVYMATAFHDGLSVVLTKSGYGAVNAKGEVVVKPKYCYLLPYSDQVAIGMENKYKDEDDENSMVSVIDKNGETLFSFKASKYYDIFSAGSGFYKGLLAVCKKDGSEYRWGFINKAGEEVIKPTAKNAKIGEWNESVYIFSDGDQWGLKKISNEEVLIRCKYDELEFADENGNLLWAGERNGREYKWSLINRKGDLISRDTYKNHKTFTGDFCPVQVSDNEWSFINKKGEEQKLKADIYTVGGRPETAVIFSMHSRARYWMNRVSDVFDYLDYDQDSYVQSGVSILAELADALEEMSDYAYDTFGDYLESTGGAAFNKASDFVDNSIDPFEKTFETAASRLLTESDLYGISKANLRILRNSIYARHGYIFKSDDLKQYFSKFPWYRPTSSDVSSQLSSIEKKNVDFIKAHE
jgi:hypothetical protein